MATKAKNHEGGRGEVLENPKHSTADANMIRRATRERWPIPKDKRAQIAKRLSTIAATAKDSRAAIGAARTLATMDGLNQADEHMDDKNGRIDVGKATERIEGVTSITVNVIGAPESIE